MDQSSSKTLRLGKLGTLFFALSALVVAGCGAEAPEGAPERGEPVDTVSQAATNWTNLVLQNGWENYNSSGNPPSVRVTSNNTVTFRGAIKGPAATSSIAFTLDPVFRAINADYVNMRVVMRKNGSTGTLYGGTLGIDLTGAARVYEDGTTTSPGPNSKIFTSLEGVSFDISAADALEIEYLNGTSGLYPFRLQGNPPNDEPGGSAKLVGGFVRMQGMITGANPLNPAAKLPQSLVPGQHVWMPISLCPGTTGAGFAELLVMNSGDMFVWPKSPADGSCMASLEGVSFALSPGGTTLALGTGWMPFNPRPVRARDDGGIIRLQGSVYGGTGATTTVATLPSTMRPPATVYVASSANGQSRARLVINTSGTIVVDAPALSIAKQFLTLDGVFFSK